MHQYFSKLLLLSLGVYLQNLRFQASVAYESASFKRGVYFLFPTPGNYYNENPPTAIQNE